MRLTSLLFTLALCTAADQALADSPAGLRKISVVTQDYPRSLAVTVWYPSASGGAEDVVADDRIFVSPPTRSNAEISQGCFPLILLSHGSGSRAEGMGWIAAELAQAGFVVAAPNHPGTTSGDSTPASTPKIWERTADISTVITALVQDPKWRSAIDPDHIGILGFSLGGTTAMELAGARGDLSAYIRYCQENPAMMDCQWFRGGQGYAGGERVDVEPFDLSSVDRARFEQSGRDPRITAAVAVDPGLATTFQPESLRAIDLPVVLINLGSSGEIPVAVAAENLARQITGARYAQVDGADHFSFLPVCRKGAAEFLQSIGEHDPICGETARPRADIHAELSRLIIGAFKRTLKPGH
ncbi:MAG: alpha/beta fold hydrolase [Alphaproteobacteria bacterium]|nr:alpha/beta fold hydrolase [Alphaproteobacteria bacterium]MBU1549742.1 alpha/beta fold hydrolase [Alphaproteobacteria bacterium]MBU2339169.1 alpha/beta fold hydrolase [Alphaproteobacteria bacterium]MBU2389091.1 alpha/beta fold hydrolase [Alphaproteobacteria bacterium]